MSTVPVTKDDLRDVYARLTSLDASMAKLTTAVEVRNAQAVTCQGMNEAHDVTLHGDGNGKPGVVIRVDRVERVIRGVCWVGGVFMSVVTAAAAIAAAAAAFAQK